MNTHSLSAALALVLILGCGKKDTAPPATGPTNAAASANPITAPVDYLGAVGQAQRHSAKVVDLVQVRQAIQQFHAMEDRYPKDLQELVSEKYLARLPTLPAGQRLVYDAASGQVRIVSSGSTNAPAQ